MCGFIYVFRLLQISKKLEEKSYAKEVEKTRLHLKSKVNFQLLRILPLMSHRTHNNIEDNIKYAYSST